MQGKIFRVAHLGFFDYLDTVALLGAMEHIAKDTLGLPVVYGSGGGGGAGSVREKRDSDSGYSSQFHCLCGFPPICCNDGAKSSA
jgi:hypothetical protein